MIFVWIFVPLVVLASASYQTYDRRALGGSSYKPSYGYSGYGGSYTSGYETDYIPSYVSSPRSSYESRSHVSSYGPRISRSGYSYDPKPEHTYKPVFVYRPPKPEYKPPPIYQSKSSYIQPHSYSDDGYGKYNPCTGRKEGDYVLDGDFRGYFPDVNPECNFVKCANYKAYPNRCSYGTKNDKYGNGFCSYLDSHHECGYPPPKKDGYH